MYRTLTVVIFGLLISAATALAQNLAVGDVMKLPIPAGEGQSTVVPPNINPQCKAGRFLVSNDRTRPPTGVVSGRDLDKKESSIMQSTFDMGSLAANFNADKTQSNYIFVTNDHDLVTLPNGDVLYLTGAFSRMPTGGPLGPRPVGNAEPKPATAPVWWQDAGRTICLKSDAAGNCRKAGRWGPGARSVVLVWRSRDCGEHFEFVSEFDPARFNGGLCAMPQFRKDAKQAIIPDKPYEAGGTDGQLVKVDPDTGRVYMTFGCVGYHSMPGKHGEFLLNPKGKIEETLVAAADNQGARWTVLGSFKQSWWRAGIAMLSSGELGFGLNNAVLLGHKVAGGHYQFDPVGFPAPEASLDLMYEGTFAVPNKIPLASISSNVWASPVITRSPGANGYILAYPAALGGQGYGYHLYFYDQQTKKLCKPADIVPAKPGPDNFIFHLTAIDPGKGPILLYWYDFDSVTRKATIRGKLITGDAEYSDDFLISQIGGKPHTVELTHQDYWFGDYLSGGGFVSHGSQSVGQGKSSVLIGESTIYSYYPMWVEPDGTVRYTNVQYAFHIDQSTIFGIAIANKPRPIKLNPVPQKKWGPQPPPVMLTKMPGERELTREEGVQMH